MRNFMRFLVVLGVAALVAASARAAELAAPKTELYWLAFGDLRGHIEPCGCDPATDLGGVRRLAAVVARERALKPQLQLLDLGNNVPPPKEPALKAPFIVGAEAAMAPTAALLNVLEMARWDELAALRKKGDAVPRYLLTNRRPKASIGEGTTVMSTASSQHVFGYVWPVAEMGDLGVDLGKIEKSLVRVSPELLAKWHVDFDPLKQQGPNILLFSGPDEDLQKLVASKIFDVIVTSNTSKWSADPGVAEHDDETKLQRRVKIDGQPILMVPLGGQGMLRGGGALFAEAKSVADYLKPTCAPGKALDLGNDCARAGTGSGGETSPFRTAKIVTWLDPKIVGDGGLTKLWADYEAAVKTAFKAQSESRARDLANSPFAGAEACASCHPKASATWAKTAHAHAMKELKDKGKHEDQECVACHSVGANVRGGFVSLELSPKLANVQCENCHGPRAAHVKARGPAVAGGPRAHVPETCVVCHNAQHSPAFKAEEYWRKIAHGKE
jgi:hypothetical protein